MPGNRSQDPNESAEAKWIMVWNHNPLMKRLRGLQDDMTTDLVHRRVLPSPAQGVGKVGARDVAW